jgi:hypothetical protein
MTYVFQRGETVGISLALVAGYFADVAFVTAAMKPLAAGRSHIDAATPAIPLSVAADGIDGWTLTLDAASCAALVPGGYVADARLVVGSGVVITDPVAIRIVEAVTS